MSQESIPPKRAYTAAHWGVYAFEQQDDGHLSILPYEGDPDPSPIGLFMDAPAVRHNRVRRPAIREGWLNWRTGRAQADTRARGEERFIEVSWEEALSLAARALDDVRQRDGNGYILDRQSVVVGTGVSGG